MPAPSRLSWCSLGFAVLAGCSKDKAPEPATPAATEWRDESPHTVRDYQVNGVRLNLLDWGGSGPDLVLIHGLGDSPHIFDDLAPLLTGEFHVVAYARRGHAGSDQKGPYDNLTLTEDLRQLLDTLGIKQASLLGWSMGGNEISELAAHDPARVSGLVYLDAAYDWSDPRLVKAFETLPVAITATAEDAKSLTTLRRWYQRVWLPEMPWPKAWEAHLRDLVAVGPDGTLRMKQTDSVNALMFASLTSYHKDYRRIKAPALSLISPDFLPRKPDDSATAAKVAAWERDYFGPFRQASIRRFRAEVAQSADSILPNTSHASIGAVDVDGLARLVTSFLRDHARK